MLLWFLPFNEYRSLDKDNVPPVIDPCDKNVVVSALKQKRSVKLYI